jgi:hypothetical protein
LSSESSALPMATLLCFPATQAPSPWQGGIRISHSSWLDLSGVRCYVVQ